MGVADLRGLPSVERLVQFLEQEAGSPPRALLVGAARDVVDDARTRLLRGDAVDVSFESLSRAATEAARARVRPTLTRAVNATGIILHTNLGRAPLSSAAESAVGQILSGYSTLEIEPHTGRRGSRHYHVEPL